MTHGEKRLWTQLRKLKAGWRRQSPMGRYTLDFVSHAARLVVEVDGYYHSLPERQASDADRDAWLGRQGYRVLRFSDADVIRDAAAVALLIAQTAPPPSPALPPSRGKGGQRVSVSVAVRARVSIPSQSPAAMRSSGASHEPPTQITLGRAR